MAKPRVKVPKKAKVGDIVEIKTMISHKMETGLRKDKKTGKVVPRKIINHLSAKFNGKDVFSTIFYPSVSANPYVAFNFKVPGSGEMVFTWTEDGGKTTTAKKKITAA
jgi:sulfur-oxidizing protein SoxZ